MKKPEMFVTASHPKVKSHKLARIAIKRELEPVHRLILDICLGGKAAENCVEKDANE